MRIAIVADVYPPLRSSGAVQLRDLSQEFVRQGHDTTVLVASPELDVPCGTDDAHGVRVVRLRTPRTKEMGYVRRLIGELAMPFAMMRNLSRSSMASARYDAVIWYSPTIFLGPIVRKLKVASQAPSYLIIRDIFPQWAADMGLIPRGPILWVLDAIANYQYRSADVIGVQTPGNIKFFDTFNRKNQQTRIEVLQNWLAPAKNKGCAIDLSQTRLAGRRIFAYAGNMGVAQQMDKLLDMALALRERTDVGFLFVGRGSETDRLAARARDAGADNILFHDEISPDDIPGLYAQVHVGLISLDSRHQTHNIPGKFLTYMQAGLPVLASINLGNDLASLVSSQRVGRVSTDPVGADLAEIAKSMLEEELQDFDIQARCRILSDELFSARAAVEQIVKALRLK
jgi:glycosyltransferase involved in cell wall biosynthesis